MTAVRLLIVEDDKGIQEMLDYAMAEEGYVLYSAYTARQGWDWIQQYEPDMVLLDWMLPDSSGIELLHRIRKSHPGLPVIMVTAKSEEEDRIAGLDVGADDYITKPFSVRELKSRIQAVLRRTRSDKQMLQLDELLLDPTSHRVAINDAPLSLTPIEFRLLHYFMLHPDRVFSRAQLLDQVWGQQVYVEERTVDVHIRRLRKQLQPYGLDNLLQTVHGSGYRFSRQ